MARYVDTALRPGEKILYDARVHWAIFIAPLWQLIFFGIVASVFGFFTMIARADGDFRAAFSEIGKATGFHWLEGFSPFSIVFVIIVFAAFGGIVRALIYYFNSDFVLTDRRVIAKFGLLSRTTSEQRLSKVESIHVYQSFLGRLLNYGNITVTGTGSSETKFGPMVDPVACKHALEEQLDKVRDRHED